jgi:phage terminase large subunit-like protein
MKSNLTAAEEKLLAELVDGRTFDKWAFFTPYPKQQQFFELGETCRERLLIAGNQLGKSEAGAFEVACHLTGDYPPWWTGRRFDGPVKGWASGIKSKDVRDVAQKKLCGEAGVDALFGTGYIPKDRFCDKPSLSRGVTDAFDTIQVRHKSGGVSVLRFKSYEEGRKGWQGETLDFVWFDEEPPEDLYSEGLTRTAATKGFVFVTFTPLMGLSNVVKRYLQEPSSVRRTITMTIYDALHFTDEERAAKIAEYPAHERAARAMGEPMQGQGRVWPYDDAMVSEPPIREIPAYWVKLWGFDFGFANDHAFAALLGLWDKDNDVIHIHHAYKAYQQTVAVHAQHVKRIGANVPVAWPHDGHKTGPGDGQTNQAIAPLYKAQGLRMLPSHSTFPEGGYSLEAGVREIDERIRTGRLKFAAHLSDLFEEFRFYHHKDGKVVATNDDLLSALRQIIMAKRFAQAVGLGGSFNRTRTQAIALDVDFDVF